MAGRTRKTSEREGSGPRGWWLWLSFAALKIAILVPTSGRYGYFRDELYYLDCADRLAWGYVDHPPLSLGVLRATRELLGDSILAIRLPAIVAGAATIVLLGLLTRMLGGGRFAQAAACLAGLIAPVYLVLGGGFFSMNAFDLFFWALALVVLVRLIERDEARLWPVFGVIAGLGLMNKLSVLFLGAGVVVALALTPHRRHFRSGYFWLGGVLAAAIVAPHLAWQIDNGWPTLEFFANAAEFKNVGMLPHQFLLAQVVEMHPINAPLWVGGAVFGLLGRRPAHRLLSIWFLAVMALLMATRGKAYYLAPAFPAVLALGGIWLERVTTRRRWVRGAWLATSFALGALLIPMSVPVLSVDDFLRYQAASPLAAPAEERHQVGSLPPYFADRFGWEELVQALGEAYDALPAEDRARCGIFVENYGEAGAVNFFGPAYGLPRAISGHNSHFLWGPGDTTGEVMLVYWRDRQTLEGVFDEVVEVGRFRHPLVMPYQTDRPIYLCRGLRVPIDQVWPRVKHFS